ncbi:ABC transporter ATP-binding protein [Natronoglycomyces albus]|uniref:ATP-binding cassette domain-containing protein n=1 Tax=Natronoglycomyces albus TaxID=2811108 RepID=A0A895XS81_9ACTN|nr:ATP-binding cassette domain-containing protein [Natronoglycomyces albus]QSB05120.1 ATP-binding cassette domain-containing protein [Natronoglycomyces albus]
MPNTSPVLSVSDLCLTLGERTIFTSADLTVNAGESLAILGPSGSGKSSLLSVILGLISPTSGQVVIDGTALTDLRGDALANLRASAVGMVFQFGEILPELTPAENVALPALLNPRPDALDPYERAASLLETLGVVTTAPTAHLSGGERQRVAVARALINAPRLILADEPTGALDEKTRDQVASILFELPVSHHCGLLTVTHDLNVASRADRIVQIVDGRLQVRDELA